MDTPLQSPNDAEEHDETMADQSEEESEDIHHDDEVSPEGETNGHHEAPSQPTDYSLFSNPPALPSTRQRLFAVEEPIEMSLAHWELYHPYMDNVWRKVRSAEGEAPAQVGETEYYWCKLRKTPGTKAHIPRPTPDGKQPRKRRVKDDLTCNMGMKVVYSNGPVQKVTISKAIESSIKHTHDLDYMDKQKRNGAIMDVARQETSRGFLPTSVWWKMCQELDKMEAAGGKFMKVSDVRNVQYPWRQENMDVVLKAHTGFGSARSAKGQAAVKTRRRSSQQAKATPTPKPVVPTPAPHSRPAPVQQALAYQPQPPILPTGDILQYPDHARQFLQPFLPDHKAISVRQRPHITLTWAGSLDGRIAIAHGQRTALSGPETKAMTHYLRSQHDAILVGVGTAIADDPSLNCRLSGAGGHGGPGDLYQPRPVIIDPHARLHIRPEMKVLQVVEQRRAKAPWIIVSPNVNIHPVAVQRLKAHGGEYLMINDYQLQQGGFGWEGIFNVLFKEGIRSIMVEGGGQVLSGLLKTQHAPLIDSIVMTIAPTFLGNRGVQVSQDSVGQAGGLVPTQLDHVRWQPMGEKDVVMCGRVKVQPQSGTNGMLSGLEEFAQTAPVQPANGVQNEHQRPATSLAQP